MEGITIFDDLATTGIITAVIVAIIQLVKKLLEQTNWGWVQKIPGELWFGISIVLGIGLSFVMNYNAVNEIAGNTLSVPDYVGKAITGVGMGLSSKVVHAVSTPVGAKLKEVKETAQVKTQVLTSGVTPVPEIVGIKPNICESSPVVEPAVLEATPVVEPIATSNSSSTTSEDIYLLKITDSDPDYIMLNGNFYQVKKAD